MNMPIWLPTVVSIDSSSASGSRISRLKNSMTLSTSPRSRTGNPNAAWRPSRAAIAARGKFVSWTTSGIQAGSPVAQTRPGRPTPRANVRRRLVASNSGNASSGEVQILAQRRASASRSIVQSAPCSQPSVSQMASRIFGAASSIVVASRRARAATYSAVSRRSDGRPDPGVRPSVAIDRIDIDPRRANPRPDAPGRSCGPRAPPTRTTRRRRTAAR